jgi:MYXO-CTERM domain-containing protein
MEREEAMKSLSKIGLVMLGLLWTALAQAEQFDIQVSVPAVQEFKDSQGYSHVRIKGYLNQARPGSPALPSKMVPVLLPPGHRVVSVNVVPTELVQISGTHIVFPAQKLYPPSHQGPRPFTAPDPTIYSRMGSYPAKIGDAQGLQFKRGFEILPVKIRPVVFAPHSGRLSYAPAVKISIVTELEAEQSGNPDSLIKKFRARFRGLERDNAAVKRMVINPAVISEYPYVKKPLLDDDYHYVIITSQAFTECQGDNTLETLTTEKNSRGISTLVKTMAEIKSAYEGADDAEKVRNFIRDMYENHATDYVLLVGDADLEVVGGETEAVIVPVRGLWGNIEYGGDELNLPSDLYYACLDGTFDADLDGIYGEETDDPDLMAEVLVGRVPADSCTEIGNFVRKTLAYQNSTSADYIKNVWLSGEWLAPESYGAQFMEPLRTGTWNGGRFLAGFAENPFFEVSTLYDQGVCEKDCWGVQEILDVMNGGTHILHHVGHSYTNYNMRVTCDDIDAGMNNTEYFFQYTGGCYPGAFDNRFDPLGGENEVSPQDSFVEHLLLGEHGAFASIQFTRYGVGETLPKYFWNAAFGKGMKRLSEMHAYSREQTVGWVDDRYMRWQIYSLNLFGDPEVSLHMSNSSQPVLGVPRWTPYFLGVKDGENPADQVIAIRNDGDGEMEWTISSNQAWLTASPASGTAPGEVSLSVDTAGLEKGEHTAKLTVTAEGAGNSPKYVDVYLWVDNVPTVTATHTLTSPVVDGSVPGGEYEGAGFLDVGFVAAGLSTARLTHDDQKLYVALLLGDDHDADPGDVINIYIDANNDNHWPQVSGDEGLYYLADDGSVFFVPVFDDGNGAQYGEFSEDVPEVEVAFGFEFGMRIVEISFDLTSGRLARQAGESLGLGFLYWDQTPTDYTFTAAWPSMVASVGGTYSAFLGDVELGLEADRLFILPEELNFAAEAGSLPTTASNLDIQVTTESDLDFTLQTSDDWIILSESSGTTPGSIQVQADPGALESGIHSGQITVIAPGAKNSPVTVAVTFDVAEPAPVFSISPTALSFEMTAGHKLPDPQTLTIENQGGGQLNWTATPSGDWFEASSLSGTAGDTLDISLKDEQLAAGQYSGLILLTADGAEAQAVNLTLKVLAGDPDPDDDPKGCSCATQTNRPSGYLLLLLIIGLAAVRRQA